MARYEDIEAEELKLCILLVEPCPDLARALAEWFSAKEINVIPATTARESMLAIRDVAFLGSRLDGLVLNVQLPDGTGYRAITAFREEFPTQPVAAMTSREDMYLSLWCERRKIQVLRKPFVMEELERWIGGVKGAQLRKIAT